MAPKEIIFSPNAEKEIKKLSSTEQKQIFSALKKWRSSEGKPEIEKIKSEPGFFRLRAGKFRVIYHPLNSERVVILLIRDRKDAYRGLDNLPKKLETAIRKIKAVR